MKFANNILVGLILLNAFFIDVAAAGPTVADTRESNIALIRRQHELLNRGDWKSTLDLYTAESRNFGRPVGRAVMTEIFKDIYRMFPDYREDILEITASGDSVILRIRSSGTHRGIGTLPVDGGLLVGVAPTNRHFEASAIHWYTIKAGKIVDHYAVRDDGTAAAYSGAEAIRLGSVRHAVGRASETVVLAASRRAKRLPSAGQSVLMDE